MTTNILSRKNLGADFQWMEHTDVLKAMYEQFPHEERKELFEQRAAAERAIAVAQNRINWIEGLTLVRLHKAELRFRPTGPSASTGFIGIYLRTSDSPTGVMLIASACDCPEHDAEARAAGTMHASATL